MHWLRLIVPLLVAACGQSETDSGPGPGTNAGGEPGSAGGGPGSAGGEPGAEGGAPGAEGGGPGSAGAEASGGSPSGAAGASGELVDCDPRKVLCRIAAPECGVMQVPSVEGTCYGPCVDIERCACSSAAACPEEEQYTCWSGMHCGPYVR